jgi:hypothetical protein
MIARIVSGSVGRVVVCAIAVANAVIALVPPAGMVSL